MVDNISNPYTVRTIQTVALRSGQGNGKPVISVLPCKYEVTVVQFEPEDDWRRVTCKDP